MDKSNKFIVFLFVMILLMCIWGFYTTYFGKFPLFQDIIRIQHFHAVLFIAWFVVLILQPILINTGKTFAHRLIGKVTYLLVPMIVLSTVWMLRLQYNNVFHDQGQTEAIANMILALPQMLLFAFLYILAMITRKNTAHHFRYIIATSLVLIGPGLGRAFIISCQMNFATGIIWSFIVTDLILLGLIVYDKWKGAVYKPYTITLWLLLIIQLAWYFLPYSTGWQYFGRWFAEVFF